MTLRAALAAVLGQALQVLRAATAFWSGSSGSSTPPPPLRLDRYQRSVTRPDAAKPVHLRQQAGGPRLVETGSFRVDISRLLDKLRAYQLEDPADFILCWLRCAVASGATCVELDLVPGGVRLAFDGKPLPAKSLDEPYSALLDRDSPEARRARHFAYGLLAVQRLDPELIEAASGEPGARVSMSFSRKGSSTRPEPARGSEGRTVLQVVWRSWLTGLRGQSLLSRAAEAFGMAATELRIGGGLVPSDPWESPSWKAKGEWLGIEEKGWRGALCVVSAHREDLRKALVHVHVLGTRVQTLVRPHYPAFVGFIARDDLGLDISQSRVIEDARLDEGFEILSDASYGR